MRLNALIIALGLVLLGVSVEYVAGQGPLTNFMNLRGRTDANGYLMVTSNAAGAQGPLTAIGNLRSRVDANGYLMVAIGAGDITLVGQNVLEKG